MPRPIAKNISKTENMAVITPQRKSLQNIVNSTPVNSVIGRSKSIEPTQSPIERSYNNNSVSTGSQTRSKTISKQNLSYCESSSFNSTPKCSKRKPISSLRVFAADAKTDDHKKKLSSKDADENITSKPIKKSSAVQHSKSKLSPTAGLKKFDSMDNEKPVFRRLTRSFTRLNSDPEISNILSPAPPILNNIEVNTNTKNDQKNVTSALEPIASNNLKSDKTTCIKKTGKSRSITSRNISIPQIDNSIPLSGNLETEKVNPEKLIDNQKNTLSSAKDNNSLYCSKIDSSGQNENSRESCDSWGKRISDNLYCQSLSKPSFIRRKLYSQQSNFNDNDNVKTADASFLETNNLKNVYVAKKKSLTSQNRRGSLNNDGSNKSSCSEPVKKSADTLRTYCLRKNQKDLRSGDTDKGVNSDSAIITDKGNTCQFIADLLKDIHPKNVPQVVTANVKNTDVNDNDAQLEKLKDSEETFDLFAKNGKPIKKSIKKTKPVKSKTIHKSNVTKNSRIIEAVETMPKCFSSSDSDSTGDDRVSDTKIKRKQPTKNIPVKQSKSVPTKQMKHSENVKNISSRRSKIKNSPVEVLKIDNTRVHSKNRSNRLTGMSLSNALQNQESTEKPLAKTKQLNPKAKCNGDIERTGRITVKADKKTVACFSSSDSSLTEDECSISVPDKRLKRRQLSKKAPVRYSKMLATKKIRKFAEEEKSNKVNCSSVSGEDFSSEEYSDESPFFTKIKNRYTEEYTSEEYNSPIPVFKTKKANFQNYLRNPPNTLAGKAPSNEVEKYVSKSRIPSSNRFDFMESYSVHKKPNDLSVNKYNNIKYPSCSKTVQNNMQRVENFATTIFDSTEEKSVARKAKRGDDYSHDAFKWKGNFADSIQKLPFENQFTSRRTVENGIGKLKDNFYSDVSKVRNGEKWNGNGKNHYNRRGDDSAFNKRSSTIENLKHSTDMSWYNAINHVEGSQTGIQEFKLPRDVTNSEAFKRKMRMEQYELKGERNASMLRSSKWSQKVQNTDFSDMKFNFSSNSKLFSQNSFGSTFTERRNGSRLNKMNTGPGLSSMTSDQKNISHFNKTTMELATETRHLVHSLSMYQKYPEMPLGKPAQSNKYVFGDSSYLKTDFCNSRNVSSYKKYNHKECVKMNTFGNIHTLQNESENSLYLSDYRRSQFLKGDIGGSRINTMIKQSQGHVPSYKHSSIPDSARIENEPKYVNYKSLSAMGHPSSYKQNQTYRGADLMKNKILDAREEESEAFESNSHVDAMFKMPLAPPRKRLRPDVDDEQYKDRSKIARCNGSLVSSFNTTAVSYSSLKRKENLHLHQDESYIISGTSHVKKNCSFQKKSKLSGPIGNSTFLGNTLKNGTCLPDNLISIKNNYISKQILPKKSSHISANIGEKVVKSKTSHINDSNINNDNFTESSGLFQNSDLNNKFIGTMKDQSLLKYKSLLPKEKSFIVKYNGISDISSFKEPVSNSLVPAGWDRSEEFQSKQQTPEKHSVKDINRQLVNHSPWRFAALK